MEKLKNKSLPLSLHFRDGRFEKKNAAWHTKAFIKNTYYFQNRQRKTHKGK